MTKCHNLLALVRAGAMGRPVLCHGDVGFHNMAFEPGTLDITGLFDFDDACANQPEWDLRYLTFDPKDHNHDILSRGLDAYERAGGDTPSLKRTLVFNALSAISYLAFRENVSPLTRWCGRTLEEDLAWTRLAIANAHDAVDQTQ